MAERTTDVSLTNLSGHVDSSTPLPQSNRKRSIRTNSDGNKTFAKNIDKETKSLAAVDDSEYSVISSGASKSCGCGKFKPSCLQIFHNAKCFLACLCLCSITQGMIINGLIPISITTLEKRFHLTSTNSGFLASFYDIAVILALPIVSHFGEKGHKPKWISLGIVIMGVGSIIFTLPHFILGPFFRRHTHNDTCIVQDDVIVTSLDYLVSYAPPISDCSANTVMGDESTAYVRRFFFILLLGQLLHGLGAAPLYTLGVTFLDESVSQTASPVYLGVFYGFSILGPAFGFVMGGTLLRIHGDIDKNFNNETILNVDDPLWYGAWWIGFLIAGLLAIVFGTPILMFSRRLPEAEANRAKDIDQAQGVKRPHLGRQIKDFPKAILQLVKNKPFVCIVAMKCAEAFLMNGFITFIPKMLENFFSMSSSISSLLAAVCYIKTAYVISKHVLMHYTLLGLANCMLYVISRSSFVPGKVINECNIGCQCSIDFNPVCHLNSSLVYYSPCHAGCTNDDGSMENDSKENLKQWSNCSCVSKSTDKEPQSVVQGFCPISCNLAGIFLVICGIQVFMIFVAAMPVQQVELRCVPFQQRTLAVSFSWVFVRLLGTIPGAILIGNAIDNCCSLWKWECGEKVSCLRYSNSKFSYSVLAFGLSLKLVIIAFLIVARCLYKPNVDDHDDTKSLPAPILSKESKEIQY